MLLPRKILCYLLLVAHISTAVHVYNNLQEAEQDGRTIPGLDIFSRMAEHVNNSTILRILRQLQERTIGLFQPDVLYQECRTLSGGPGRCRHLQHCVAAQLRTFSNLLSITCLIEGRYVGVCCPETEEAGVGEGQRPGSEAAGPLPAIDPGLEQPASNAGTSNGNITTSTASEDNRGCGVSTVKKIRIVGGQPAEPGEWPWMVALIRVTTGFQFCGGVLITDQHILTASHCVEKQQPKDLRVRLGEYDLSRTDETRAQEMAVSEIHMHEDYSRSTYENDIAILKMDRRAMFSSYVWPICLPPPGPTFENATAFVIGWGTQSYGGPTSDILMEVAVPVWNQTRCAKRFAQPLMETTLCAGAYEGGKDSCQGDSGGPLMVQLSNGRWTNIGVVSWGVRCGEPNTPGIYTRVNQYLPWIVRNSVS